ncbi:MAG TPA: hypoxanthine phosphoribosyltransferase [Thermoanaerobaculia bacterium]|nr:hypoxanthine phosphoribosyltransferase [Thermoanaerobaculia bacterium]
MRAGNGNVRVLISRRELDLRVSELAAEIDRDYGREKAERPASGEGDGPDGDPLVCVGVLKGSVFFLADLLKQLTIPLAVDFLQAASYGAGIRPGELRIRKDIDLEIGGRDVLLIEDIVDTGRTVSAILALLRCRGARSVRLCALLDKQAARQVEVEIDYRGFEIPDHFVVGYGLDVGERFRNLPYIGVWKPAAPAS